MLALRYRSKLIPSRQKVKSVEDSCLWRGREREYFRRKTEIIRMRRYCLARGNRLDELKANGLVLQSGHEPGRN
jgi:hypothetical protein